MTVASETPIATATANGVTTVFPYAYTVLKTGDVKVQGVLAGVTTVYTLGVDYTLSGIGTPAGSVNFVAAPANGTIITSYRDTSLTRSTDYQTAGDLFADIIDADFDRLWLVLQEIVNGSRSSSRALQVPVGETVNALPVLATRASKFLAFDGSGQPVAAAGVTGSPATTFGAALIASATAALGRGVLGSGVTGDALFLTATAAAARAVIGAIAAGLATGSGLTVSAASILGGTAAGAVAELTPAQVRTYAHTTGTVQVFTASGTYTKPAGLLFAIVEVLGAGGGGGGSSVSPAIGGGGGAGGYGSRRLAAASIGATETVTVGAGGTAGSSAGGAGGTGGTSSFGALVSCTGGAGGGGATAASFIAGGAGGTSTGADVNTRGAVGGNAIANATNGFGAAGQGAASMLGGNGSSATNNANAAGGSAQANSGSGGGGASAGGSSQVGGVGGSGIVIVWEFY